MTKSTRFALFIILTLILCDCDELTQVNESTSVSNYSVNGAYKVTTSKEEITETSKITTEKNVQQYNQQKFRVEKVNNLALELQKNMSNEDISDFIQKQMAAKNSNSESAKKMEVYEKNLDAFIFKYKQEHQSDIIVDKGSIKIEKKIKFLKEGREIFYDPQFMNVLWSKLSLLLERNELNQDCEVYQMIDEEFLKDDIIDFVSVIKKSTWFVFKYSKFMPFWLETIGFITDPEFLSAASKEELIYLHFYIKKMFRIFTRVLVGNKTKKRVKLFFLIFAQVTQELAEYEFAVNLLFKYINVENKGSLNTDYSNLMKNQGKILETLRFIRENKYMEAIDQSLSDEMQKLDDMMTKMNQGIQLSLGDIEVTTIIKTHVIDVTKKITKRINLILTGELLEKLKKSRYYGHLTRILKSLQDLLNSHMLDSDENVEVILQTLDLFLLELEKYLESMRTEEESYLVNKDKHSRVLSSLIFFVSKIETANSIKSQENRRKYTLFLLRIQLFLLALEKPVQGDDVPLGFDDPDFTYDPNTDLSDNLDDLFGEFEELNDDPEVSDKVKELREGAERTLYIIDRNIDLTDRPVDPKLQNFFNQFKNEVAKFANKKSMLQPFYMRMYEIFTESEKSLSILATFDFIKQLQDLYIKLKVIQQSQEDFEEESLENGSTLGRVMYNYKEYRESVHKQVPEILKHLTYICAKCDRTVLAGIGNYVTSHKNSLVDAIVASRRLTMMNDDLKPNSDRVVYVIEVLDCENSNIFVKLMKKKNIRLI
jgi:hypothetical protein